MILLDDQDTDDIPHFERPQIKSKTFFDSINTGFCIMYDYKMKNFLPEIHRDLGVFVGQLLNKENNLFNVLYKGFLLKDPVTIAPNIKDQYASIFIKKEFEHTRDSIIALMPRVKRLKRINLKMITKDLALILYDNLDRIEKEYSKIFGYEESQIFKARLVTTPFFINDNGIIKLYSIERNELKDIDIEAEGNFLAYFSYELQK